MPHLPHPVEQQFYPICSRQYIFYVQGFTILSHEFIVRKFSLVACDANLMFHYMIKLPYEISQLTPGLQKQAKRLTQNVHGLSWDSTNNYTLTHSYIDVSIV